MVDISDLIVWSTLVQTAVLTFTLVIFIFSFRSQERMIREQAYQKLMDDYGDNMRMLSERPELYAFQAELMNLRSLGQRGSYTREELVNRNFVVGLYDFFERVYRLYRRRWIDEDTWRQWDAFLRIIAAHPLFKDVHISSAEMFDKPFVDYVSTLFDEKKTAGPEN